MEQSKANRLPFGGLSADSLRLFAMVGMLLDHAWATVVSGNFWMTCVGRLVFPLYAFQLAEGFLHTGDRRRYARRLLLFALVSEIPFNLMISGSWFYPFHQNTIFTLLLGLWVITVVEKLKTRQIALWMGILQLFGAAVLSVLGFPDYGLQGVLTVVLFYLCRGFRFAWVGQLAGMILLHAVLMKGQSLPELFDLPLQSLAVLALVPIWLYNGEKGWGGKGFRQAAYLYYPLHMLALVLVRQMM